MDPPPRKDKCECGEWKQIRSSLCIDCTRAKRGPDHHAWKGGRIIDSDGYVKVYCPEDPRAQNGRYMREHVLVMEAYLGRRLRKGENVHHINGVRTDNRPENLEVWVINQPSGQRAEDLLAWAQEIIENYQEPIDISSKEVNN